MKFPHPVPFFASIAAGLLSCTLALGASESQEMAQSDLHDIMTDKISEAVARMELLLYDTLGDAVALEEARHQEALVIARAAAELQHSVDMIIELQPKLAPTQAEAPQFTALAKQLQTQAAQLEGLARERRYTELKPAVDEMKTTCSNCHHQFRGY